MSLRERECYLGDGCYASVERDRELLWLRAPRRDGDHVVGLEPQVLDQFLEFVCRMGYADNLERALNQHRGGGR